MNSPQAVPKTVDFIVAHPSLGDKQEKDDIEHNHSDDEVEYDVGYEELSTRNEDEVGKAE